MNRITAMCAAAVVSMTAACQAPPARPDGAKEKDPMFDLQAHRGGRGLRPENTLAAFRHALGLGVTTLGQLVRLPGGGNAGRRGGPPGDFVLTVEVDQHPRYRREGADLYCSVPVGMVQAAMGGHVEVETPEGRVTIEVPAGTQTGQRFRLRKRGVPRLDGGGRGDLWAIAEVVIPAVTDDRGRSLLRELSQVLPEG